MKQLFSPAGYPRTQLNSDTIYLKTVSESMGQGFSPTRLISTSIPGQKATLLSGLLKNCLEVPSRIHDSVSVLEKLTELGIFREIFYF